MNKKIFVCLCAFILLNSLYAAAPANAASLKISGFAFNQGESADIMGPGGAVAPDGKPDAAFSLALSGASAITEITLENKDGAKWSTNTPNAFVALVGSNGQIINSGGRLSVLPVLLAANYKLYISDADKEIAKENTFTVTVKLVDGAVLTGKTDVAPAASAPVVSGDKAEGITAAQSAGVSGYDLANTGKGIGADGLKDTAIKAAFSFKNATIAGIKLQSEAGSAKSAWDTLKGSGSPLLVVLDKNENIVNKADGSVSIAVAGDAEYTLLAQDNGGVLTKSGSVVKLTVSLTDGRVFERVVDVKAAAPAKDTLTVEYKGKGKYDFAGESENLGSNLNADRQIDAALNTAGTITGIRIKSASGKIWDTIPKNNNWLVVATNAAGERLNKADGSVSIPVSGSTALSLWFEEDGGAEGPFTVTFVLANGQVIEAATAKAGGKEPRKDRREVKFLSAKPAPSNIDIVGKNKKLASNGAKDHTLKVEVRGTGQITVMTLKDSSNAGWDTLTANNGRWRLAVREGSKTLNNADGTVKINVNGAKELALFAQNNGKLSAGSGKLILEITWSGGEVTESTLTW